MKTVTIIFSVAVLSVTSACAQWWGNGTRVEGNGNEISKMRSIAGYDEISLKGSLDVALVYGEEGNIKIEAESNLIEHIVTKVEGDELKIYVEKGYNLDPSRGSKLLITVPFKELSNVSLAGSGDIYSEDVIKANRFGTSISGSGDVQLSIEASEIMTSITGSGDMVLKGTTETLKCDVTGSGDLKAYDLKAQKVYASVTGSGDIKTTAAHSIKARVTGSGDIDYQGNPEMEDKKVTGSGDITSR